MAAGTPPQPATAEQPMSRQDNGQIEEHSSNENDEQVSIKQEQSSPSSSSMPRVSALQDITAKVTNESPVKTLVATVGTLSSGFGRIYLAHLVRCLWKALWM